MSREIKFRAWVTHERFNKRQSFMLHDGDWYETKLGFADSGGDKLLVGTDGVFLKSMYANGAPYRLDAIPMQFTGLKDKHGKEIYEGDIVNVALWDGEDWSWEEGVVKWYQPSSAFKWFSLKEDQSDGNNYWLSQADVDQRQVIGNVYENPELLEQTS